MAHRRTVLLALLVSAAVSCGDDGVTATDTVNGIKYSAKFNGNISTGTGTFVNVVATLQNVSTSPQERTYLVSCPVRIRLYRPADGFKMYDETKLACGGTTEGTLAIGIGESKELQSGIRQATTMLGDSLPYQTYAVRAVLYTEGQDKEMEVVAGAWLFTAPAPGAPASK
jgi:hypothetical protein